VRAQGDPSTNFWVIKSGTRWVQLRPAVVTATIEGILARTAGALGEYQAVLNGHAAAPRMG
jgi:hypothetical protein